VDKSNLVWGRFVNNAAFYDLVRSNTPNGFGAAGCTETNGSDGDSFDPAAPTLGTASTTSCAPRTRAGKALWDVSRTARREPASPVRSFRKVARTGLGRREYHPSPAAGPGPGDRFFQGVE
jgi:hypothetical protein